jgi:hypothetical protein
MTWWSVACWTRNGATSGSPFCGMVQTETDDLMSPMVKPPPPLADMLVLADLITRASRHADTVILQAERIKEPLDA